MTNIKCVVDFDGQVLAKCVQEGGLYRFLENLVKHVSLVHYCGKMGEMIHKRFGASSIWVTTTFK